MDREEFGLWKLHPGTEVFMAHIQKLIGDGITELASGVYSQDIGKTYLAIGKLNAYKSIIEADFLEETISE